MYYIYLITLYITFGQHKLFKSIVRSKAHIAKRKCVQKVVLGGSGEAIEKKRKKEIYRERVRERERDRYIYIEREKGKQREGGRERERERGRERGVWS